MSKAVVSHRIRPARRPSLEGRSVARARPGQVRIRVKAAGVSPTDAKIRGGYVQAVFRLPPNAVLGFEAAWRGRRDRSRPSLALMWGTTSRAC